MIAPGAGDFVEPLIIPVGVLKAGVFECAREFGMTLIGLLRGRTMNIYAGRARVEL